MTDIINPKEASNSLGTLKSVNSDQCYEMVEELGNGGMGKVFKAVDCDKKTICAIKVMHNHLKDNETNLARFKREAQVSRGLNHENIVLITDFGFTDKTEPFIVMEFLEGESLADKLKETRSLNIEEFKAIFSQICKGLSYAHDSNVVHRDVKPSNVMLVPSNGSNTAKIVDFGIARVCGTTGEICPTTEAILESKPQNPESLTEAERDQLQKLTQPGEIFGSPLYMSPEQCFGEEADCRSEVYALGCMMFESLTGKPPLKGKSAMETLMERINNEAPSINSVQTETKFPARLEGMIAKALEKEPDKRYQTVAELFEVLSTI